MSKLTFAIIAAGGAAAGAAATAALYSTKKDSLPPTPAITTTTTTVTGSGEYSWYNMYTSFANLPQVRPAAKLSRVVFQCEYPPK